MKNKFKPWEINIYIKTGWATKLGTFLEKYAELFLTLALTAISVATFIYYYNNGLGLAYNDARSHLDIGRRVVEGLKPGLAQLGSVWLPLPHILMTLTIWNDFMWHSGLAGAWISMLSYVVTGIVIYKFLRELGVTMPWRLLAVALFATNINVLYLQSTAMTELLLLVTMMIGSYEFLLWSKSQTLMNLVKCAFWIMMSTLVRYDGWFLLFWVFGTIAIIIFKDSFIDKKESPLKLRFADSYQKTEGILILFVTLAGFGIALWLLWNLLIFKDPLFFALGPYSAKAQQDALETAGVLQTKYNLWLSIKFYFYALIFNSYATMVILSAVGAIVLFLDKNFSLNKKLAISSILAPLVFNIIALFFGHSVLFIQGLSGDTWFNVRYGTMLIPATSIFIGYIVYKAVQLRSVLVGLLAVTVVFAFTSYDAVTIDDARVGSSQKNVSEVSNWLKENAANEKGFVLISAASHDAIIFSSGMPMKRFIHEGTGLYWISATELPDQWARWIIMRTNDNNDSTWKLVNASGGLDKYTLVNHFPFADIYEIKPEYLDQMHLEPTNVKQK